jgi:thioredoxin reductase (NADPH)
MERDLVIIGGGPAGLSAAIYAGRAELKTTLLEKMLVGGQVSTTMDIANYPGFSEGIDGPSLASKMKAQAERFGVEIMNAEAINIEKKEGYFNVVLKKETLKAKTVIIATGSDPRHLGVKGEEDFRGKGVSYCGTCDAPFFRDKKVLVVGGGDSALKEGLHIAKFASEITLIHRRDEFRGEKIYQRQVMTNDRIQIKWNTILKSINGENAVKSVILQDVNSEEETELETDGVFIFVGTVPNTKLICQIVPKNCGGHIDTDLDMMTEVPGLFAVGDVREHSYRQVATAVGEGATAAIAAEHYITENLSDE